jgi:hypothetical protein
MVALIGEATRRATALWLFVLPAWLGVRGPRDFKHADPIHAGVFGGW